MQPNPPKDILPTPIANSAPRMIIQIGKLDGKLNASNTPVMMAEPSQMVVVGFFIKYFPIAHSKNKQAATEVAVTIRAPSPKK